METPADTLWIGVPTPGDAMFFPSLEFIQPPMRSLVVLVSDGRQDADTQLFQLLLFQDVQVFSAFDECLYWSHAESRRRPIHLLNRIENSSLRKLAMDLRGGDDALPSGQLEHFVLCGSDYCGEIVASPVFECANYGSEADARDALRRLTDVSAPDAGSWPRPGPVAGRGPPVRPSSGRRPRR